MSRELSIKELLNGDVNRLRFIHRFGTCYRVHEESVAEHSFFTVLYSMFIGLWCQEQMIQVDTGLLLEKATIHDLEEALTGDIPRHFKLADAEMHDKIEAAAGEELFGILKKLLVCASHDSTLQIVHKIWKNAKDESLEGRIVAFADYLSVLGYIWQEVNGSNVTMKQHIIEMNKYVSKFDQPSFDFIRPLVNDARQLAGRIFNEK